MKGSPTAYDRVDWQYGGEDYPEDLAYENGGTHIGLFLAWSINRGLEGELHQVESQEALEAVRNGTMTGREFLAGFCDEKFWDVDLNDEGNAFVKYYYEPNKYFADYEATLAKNLPSLYYMADTWDNYEKVAAVLDRRYAEWQKHQDKRWWEFWK